MKAIWKYPIKPGLFVLDLPKDAQVRWVGFQCGAPSMWVEIDPTSPHEMVWFQTVATGEQFTDGIYHGTVFIGSLVFHLFKLQAREGGEA